MSTDANLARAFPAKGRKLHLGGVGGGAVAFIGQVHARGCRIVGRLSPGAGIRPRPGVGPRSQPYRLARDGAGSAARPDDIDAAAITVPNHLDLPVAMAFMDAGIDVICDKPLVNTLDDPTITVNDAFKPVVRYWDRITLPEQIITSLPQALATMLVPADCGPAFIGLTQDTQERAFDYPWRVDLVGRAHKVWGIFLQRSSRRCCMKRVSSSRQSSFPLKKRALMKGMVDMGILRA